MNEHVEHNMGSVVSKLLKAAVISGQTSNGVRRSSSTLAYVGHHERLKHTGVLPKKSFSVIAAST